MPKKKINDVKNWTPVGVDRVAFTGCAGSVSIDAVIIASKGTPIGPQLTEKPSMAEVLGAMWDCAVTMRERMVMPAMPHYGSISRVAKDLQKHLDPELYEEFLRPNARVGLPPAV